MYRLCSRFETGAMCEWHQCSGCESPLQPGEFEAARIWLRGLLLNDGQGANLRAIAYQGIDRAGLTHRSVVEVVDELAWKISSGQIKVCQRQREVDDPATVVGPLAPRAAPAPAPSSSRSRSAPVAPPPPEPTTMPRNVDAAAVAAVLTEAAKSGAPFCEVCEKARVERERQTAGAAA